MPGSTQDTPAQTDTKTPSGNVAQAPEVAMGVLYQSAAKAASLALLNATHAQGNLQAIQTALVGAMVKKIAALAGD